MTHLSAAECQPVAHEDKPIGRVSFCAYPGSSMKSLGHSFVTIEPFEKAFRSGSMQVADQHYIGRIAVGVAPQGWQSSDRRGQWLLGNQTPQLRNDTRYLLKNKLKAISVDLHTPEKLFHGLQAINAMAYAMNKEQHYIQKVNEIPVLPSNSSHIEDFPDYNLSQYNSNDFAVQIFQAFVDALPQALANAYTPGTSSKAMWSNMHHPMPRLDNRNYAQTLSLTQLNKMFTLRRAMPQLLGEADLFLSHLKTDISDFDQELQLTLTEVRFIQEKYGQPLLTLAGKVLDEIDTKANVFTQTFADFAKAIEDAAVLVQKFDPPTNIFGVGFSLFSSAFDPTTTAAVVDSLVSFQKVIQTAQKASETLNQSTNHIPNAPQLMADLAQDLYKLQMTSKNLVAMSLNLPNRLQHYTSQLQAIVERVSQYFADQSLA